MNLVQILRSNKFLNKLYISLPGFLPNLFFTIFGFFKLLEYRYLSVFYLNYLRKVENKTKLEIESIQEHKLCTLLKHAYDNTHYYNKCLNKDIIKNFKISDLHKLPILSKDDLISNYSQIISKNFKKYKPVKQSTGGTTGTSANFLIDKKQYFWKEAEVLLYWERNGYYPGKEKAVMYRGGVFFPKDAVITKQPWRIDYARKLLYFSSYYSTDSNYYQYYLKICQWKPKFMHVYPSACYLFALFLIRNNLTVNLQKVFTASEKLYTYQKVAIQKAFNCKVVDHYGHGEPGIYAAGQCKHGNYHICDTNTIVEELADGTIIETNLNNYSMPFIRYKVGDFIRGKSNNICKCGSNVSYFNSIDGRSSEIIYTRDKRKISSIGFDQIFKNNNIRLGQIVQNTYESIDLNLVINKDFNHLNKKSILHELHLRIGVETSVNINIVEDIPLAPNGKYTMVVSNILKYND